MCEAQARARCVRRTPADRRPSPGLTLSALERTSDFEPSQILKDGDGARMVEVAATSHSRGLQ
jgi:hypothetical protein